jgi:hypothetical protein
MEWFDFSIITNGKAIIKQNDTPGYLFSTYNAWDKDTPLIYHA